MATRTMSVGKIIAIVVVALVVTMSVTGYILMGAMSNIKEAKSRTEADFTTEPFVVKGCWVYEETKNGRKISEYHYLTLQNEEIELRLPHTTISLHTLDRLKNGDTIYAKVLKQDLAEARAGGFWYWFKYGDRQVMAYDISKNGRLLLESEIDWPNMRGFNLDARLFLIAIPFCILAGLFNMCREKRKKRLAATPRMPRIDGTFERNSDQ